jgi:hypothetical protein
VDPRAREREKEMLRVEMFHVLSYNREKYLKDFLLLLP